MLIGFAAYLATFEESVRWTSSVRQVVPPEDLKTLSFPPLARYLFKNKWIVKMIVGEIIVNTRMSLETCGAPPASPSSSPGAAC